VQLGDDVVERAARHDAGQEEIQREGRPQRPWPSVPRPRRCGTVGTSVLMVGSGTGYLGAGAEHPRNLGRGAAVPEDGPLHQAFLRCRYDLGLS
jgi:hypothetical protein